MTLGARFLAPFGRLYHAAVLLRHFFYDRKLLSQKKAPIPIVSIGNIIAGGSGKTQLALLLARMLGPEMRTAILSRGFRGRWEHQKRPLLVDPKTCCAEECGDEPWLLASRLPEALVIVNKDRIKCAGLAAELGARLALLDDGMQHRKLVRDYEIIVIDGTRPFDRYLPQGRLREDPRRLKGADLIVCIGRPNEKTEDALAAYSSAPVVWGEIVPTGCYTFHGEPLEQIAQKPVAIFCGIGNPRRFLHTVEQLGGQIVSAHFVGDHRLVKEKKLIEFARMAKLRGAEVLLCTEKDRVKLKQVNLPLALGWIRTELEIVKNQQAWQKALYEIKALAVGCG